MSRCTAEETEAKLDGRESAAISQVTRGVSEVKFEGNDRDDRPRRDSGGESGYQDSRYSDRAGGRGRVGRRRADHRELSRDRSSRSPAKCFGCGGAGHRKQDCPSVVCYECGKRGHMSRECPSMRRGRDGRAPSPAQYSGSRSPSPGCGRYRAARRSYDNRSPSPYYGRSSTSQYVSDYRNRDKSPGARRGRSRGSSSSRDKYRSSNRSPSPYPNRGKDSSPSHYIRRVGEYQIPFSDS